MAITQIQPVYRRPPYQSPLSKMMPQIFSQMLMGYIRDQRQDKQALKRIEVQGEFDEEAYKREIEHDVTMAEKRADIARGARVDAAKTRRTELTEQRQYDVLKSGWTEVFPEKDKDPMSTPGPNMKIGDRHFQEPERPLARVSPIKGTKFKMLTWRQEGTTHARIMDPPKLSQWLQKETYYKGLLDKKLITPDEYKRATGLYIEEKTIPMYKRHARGTQSVQVRSEDVKKFEGLDFKQGKWTPDKETKRATPASENTLIKSGEAVIAKGLGMDVSLMDRYDINRQKVYFDHLKLYHKILELKPDLKTPMGVRKAVNFSRQVSAIAVNKKTGEVIGKSRRTGKWINLQ